MFQKTKRVAAFLLVSILSFSSFSTFAADSFPQGPDETLTPGELCNRPDARRYPEGIKYCNRKVDTDQKKEIFEAYDQLGYRTRSMRRNAFKIDHYIPLCMGGSNDSKNLWPQHESIFKVTDPLEPVLCNKMSEGKLLQKDAVELIKKAKAHLDLVDQIIAEVESL